LASVGERHYGILGMGACAQQKHHQGEPTTLPIQKSGHITSVVVWGCCPYNNRLVETRCPPMFPTGGFRLAHARVALPPGPPSQSACACGRAGGTS